MNNLKTCAIFLLLLDEAANGNPDTLYTERITDDEYDRITDDGSIRITDNEV